MLQAISLLCLRGERELFRNLDFALGAGEMLLVSGRNGAGKTSLLRLVCGLARPEAGEVRWAGENVRSRRETYARAMAYLGHHNGVKDELTPLENLRASAALAGIATDESALRAALDRVGLAECEDLPARHLSQGQKRRAALARLTLADACLWVLDEPLASLDVNAAALLEGMLASHLGRGGVVVLTTHQPLGMRPTREIRIGD